MLAHTAMLGFLHTGNLNSDVGAYKGALYQGSHLPSPLLPKWEVGTTWNHKGLNYKMNSLS